MSERTTDEPYVTHMLGYLTPGKWADAIRNGLLCSTCKNLAKSLALRFTERTKDPEN